VTAYAHVGTFTSWDDQPSEGVYSFAVDPDDGSMASVGITALDDPSFLAVSSRGVVYVATHTSFFEGEPGAGLVAYAVEPGGTLRRLGHARVPSPHPVYVSLDRAERFVLVASGLGGAVSAFAIAGDGTPGPAASVLQLDGAPSVPLGVRSTIPMAFGPGAPHPHCIVTAPDNRFALVPNLTHERVHVLAFEPRTGALRPHGAVPSPGPRHVAFHPRGSTAYVLNETGSSVSVFAWDAGRLTHLETVSTLPRTTGAGKAADVHVHPSGRFLYASNRGHDSIAAFAISGDGCLTPIGHTPTGRDPRGFAIAPGGELLLVAAQGSGDVRTYRIDGAGRLEPTGARAAVPSAVCVRFSSDQAYG
jgi:6-phosphogluconolactonase